MMSVTAVPIQPIKKGSLTKLWIGIGIVLIMAAGLAYTGTQSVVEKNATNAEFLAKNADADGVETTKSGLQYKVIKAGEGKSPIATDTALVKYKGSLRDGTVFDENEQAPMPVGGVVPGFSEALQLMQKGGEYRIWIPTDLGYGDAPSDTIPPGSLLIFDVTLLDFISQEQMLEIQQQMQQQQMQQQQMQQQGGRGIPLPGMPGR